MSKREVKRIERRAFERGIVFMVCMMGASVLGYDFYLGNVGFVGACCCVFLVLAALKGGVLDGAL